MHVSFLPTSVPFKTLRYLTVLQMGFLLMAQNNHYKTYLVSVCTREQEKDQRRAGQACWECPVI